MSHQSKNILVVDSESEALHQFTKKIDSDEAVVHTVSDAEAVFEILSRDGGNARIPSPDLIVLDLDLPQKGLDVLSKLKSDVRSRCIPVIAFASDEAGEKVQEAYDLHVNAVFRKPYDSDEFGKLVAVFEDFWLSQARLPPKAA